MKDIKKIFEWAKEHGDAKIDDRILVSLLPILLKNNMKLTSTEIEASDSINVSDELYEIIKIKSEELVGSSYSN